MSCEDHASSLGCHLRDCFLMFTVMSLFLSVHVVVIHVLEIFILLHCGFVVWGFFKLYFWYV